MTLIEKDLKQVIKKRKGIAGGALSSHARKIIRKDTRRGWAYISPGVIYTIIFIVGAVAIALYLMTQSGSIDNLHKSSRNNFLFIFQDSYMRKMLWKAAKTSFEFTFWVSLIGIVASVIIVAILNTTKIKGKNIYMTLLFLPQVTSIVASGLIFTKIFGVNGPFGWNLVREPEKVLMITIILYIWLSISGSVVIYNTAFTTIDKTQYENAKIEGSSPIRTFFKITIPNLSNILMYSLFTSFIGGFAVFDAPYVIGGYVGGDTSEYATLAYIGYSYLIGGGAAGLSNVGVGMAILTSLSVVMFVGTILVNKIQPITKKRM